MDYEKPMFYDFYSKFMPFKRPNAEKWVDYWTYGLVSHYLFDIISAFQFICLIGMPIALHFLCQIML